MPIVSSVIARVLAFLNGMLSYFTGYSPGDASGPCNTFDPSEVWLTPCGDEFLMNTILLWQMIEELFRPLQMAMAVVAGLLTTN